MFISSLAFSLFEAKSIGELADANFMCFTSFAIAFYFLLSILKISQILALIGEFHEFIEKSKFNTSNKVCQKTSSKIKASISGSSDSISKAIYDELSEKIERMSQMFIDLVKLTIPGLLIPAIFITLANYFVYDSGDDSFFLPFRAMYVSKSHEKYENLLKLSFFVIEGYRSIGRHHSATQSPC